MRVANWKGQEVFNDITQAAFRNANDFMDSVVSEAKRRCPVDPYTYREGKFSSASVSFTPTRGSNKGNLVHFGTQKRWMGREPGNLRDTIRRVNKAGTGNIRVYAGNFKIYWAHMVERGYQDRAGKYHSGAHFLSRAFFHHKNMVKNFIEGKK